jgi:predicted nucleic acid-binding protein
MMIYYLDSSAWVKRYFQESGTDWVQNLFIQYQKFACSSLGLVEVLATLARRTKSIKTTGYENDQIMQNIEQDWKRFIHIRLTSEVLDIAKNIAYNQALRGADAVHLASALVLQKRFINNNQLIFVTSDHELKIASNAFNILTIDPNDK